MNSKLIIAHTAGPSKPKPRDPFRAGPEAFIPAHLLKRARGRNEFAWTDKPSRSTSAELQCDDFRAGSQHEETFYLWIDPRSVRRTVMRVEVSASNLKGNIISHLKIESTVKDSTWDQLVDVDGRDRLSYPTQALILDALESQSYDALEMTRGE